MAIELTTNAERQAEHAENLTAFSGIKILHIKRQVDAMLSQIGRGQIFDEYTKHDISHIDSMLKSLDWLIPQATQKIMSPADWLLITLAIYFHDLGMLVTNEEFNSRANTDFPQFKHDILYAGANGADLKAKLAKRSPEESERFLYQEFVRHRHASRIRNWITGPIRGDLGNAQAAAEQINASLQFQNHRFRTDLGLICESHHLDDLGDLRKYRVSQPYGNDHESTANLQYCAVILRTADLLDITRSRAPSIDFRLINPSDPVSQLEWSKQNSVDNVRPKSARDEEGAVDERAVPDTIEIHAYFDAADGFFGLSSYILYCVSQLKKSNEWISSTLKSNAAKHQFPWRKIDDSNIEAVGFLKETFEFKLDQAKILDLLTGHTLYNDTRVVIRELIQNSIDAIRIQRYGEPATGSSKGTVKVSWIADKRILTVQDDGTGMSQTIINNYLLNVGSSRYQDPEFKKTYPNFSSISRFGIGVLSAFMIADEVEIITCHPDDDQARHLILRSVHGRYLIRLLDKHDSSIRPIFPHGTIFNIRVRPSIEMEMSVRQSSIGFYFQIAPY